MTDLFTKHGRLLQRVDDHLYARSGRYLGQIANLKIYDPNGRYCGTIVGDRVVYRTIDSAAPGEPSLGAACQASTHANRKGSPVWGVEPPFAD